MTRVTHTGGCARRPRNLVEPRELWFITPLVVPSARRRSPLLVRSYRKSTRVIDGRDAWRNLHQQRPGHPLVAPGGRDRAGSRHGRLRDEARRHARQARQPPEPAAAAAGAAGARRARLLHLGGSRRVSLPLCRHRGSIPGLPAVHDRQANRRRGADSCASYARRYAQANEEGRIAAGFEMHPADTPRSWPRWRRSGSGGCSCTSGPTAATTCARRAHLPLPLRGRRGPLPGLRAARPGAETRAGARDRDRGARGRRALSRARGTGDSAGRPRPERRSER